MARRIDQLPHPPLGTPPHNLPVIHFRSSHPFREDQIQELRDQFSDNYLHHIVNPLDLYEAFFILRRAPESVSRPLRVGQRSVSPSPPHSTNTRNTPPAGRYEIPQNLQLEIDPSVREDEISTALGLYNRYVKKIERKRGTNTVYIDCHDESGANLILEAFHELQIRSYRGVVSHATTRHPENYRSPPPPHIHPPPLTPPPLHPTGGTFSGVNSLFAIQARQAQLTPPPPRSHSPVFNSADTQGYTTATSPSPHTHHHPPPPQHHPPPFLM